MADRERKRNHDNIDSLQGVRKEVNLPKIIVVVIFFFCVSFDGQKTLFLIPHARPSKNHILFFELTQLNKSIKLSLYIEYVLEIIFSV